MSMNRRQILTSAMALPLATTTLPSWASTWPAQPLRIHIGYPTGGAADMIARALASGMEQLLGQPVVIDHRPGAGGSIAASFVARQPSDGYQLYLADTGSMSIIPNLRTVPYDPVRDFSHLSYVGSSGLVVLVNPQVPANDIPGLIRLLKDKPQDYAYSSSGVGSPHQLAGELFKQMTSTEMKHIPYRGAAPAMADLVAGAVQVSFATIAPALALIESGRVRALGVTSARRAVSLPNVPTISEQGVTGYEATFWFSMAAPANLPAAIRTRLRETMVGALSNPNVMASLGRLGVEDLSPKTPETVVEIIRSDFAKWGDVIRNAGIQLEG